jgi:hypothetical protein
MSRHPRAELIAKWLEDTDQVIWVYRTNPYGAYGDSSYWDQATFGELTDTSNESHFAIGPKPTEPPQKMCELAGVSFPVPSADGVHPVFLSGRSVITTSKMYWFNSAADAQLFAIAIEAIVVQAIKEAK